MTREEILDMRAGEEMDMLIAERVLCISVKTWNTRFFRGRTKYSTEIVCAWEVFMWLFVRGVVHFSNGDGDSFDITFSPTKNKDATHTIKSDLVSAQVTDDNFPRLVCRAALLAVFA